MPELYVTGVEATPAPTVRAYAFAALPTGATGMLAVVTNSNTNVWGATVAAGGTDIVLAWYNGTNWTVVGK